MSEDALIKHAAAIERGDAYVQNGVVVFRGSEFGVAETKTLEQIYHEYVALMGGPVVKPPDDADATELAAYERADFQRWFELKEARRNSEAPAEYIEKLKAARTPADVDAALHWLRNRSAPINSAIAERVEVDEEQMKEAIAEFEKAAEERAKRAEELGMVPAMGESVLLYDDEGKGYTVSLLKEIKGVDAERLRKQQDVYERRSLYEINEQDPIYRELRSAATAAAMWIKAGNRTPDDYVDSSLKRYFENLTPEAAAERLRTFEMYQDFRRRPDGQAYRHVMLAPEFYEEICERRGHKKRLRLDELPLTDPVLVSSEIDRLKKSFAFMMQSTPIYDDLFIPSRMFSILTRGQPAPRVVSYSMVFACYFAVVRLFSASPDLLPEPKAAKKMEKAEQQRLRRAGIKREPVDPRYARANEIVSKKTASDYLKSGREACIVDFSAKLKWICNNYEKRQAPVATAVDYYRHLYIEMRKYLCDVLNAYERACVLYLDKYMARSEAPRLLTEFHMPSSGIVAPEIHTRLISDNALLEDCEFRKAVYSEVRVENETAIFEGSAGDISRMPAPDIDEEMLCQHLWKEYPSTPTFAQMQKLVRVFVHQSASGPADVRSQANKARAQSRMASSSSEPAAPAVATTEFRDATEESLVAHPSSAAKPSGVAVKPVDK